MALLCSPSLIEQSHVQKSVSLFEKYDPITFVGAMGISREQIQSRILLPYITCTLPSVVCVNSLQAA